MAGGGTAPTGYRINFGTDNPPACTWLNVKGLANEDFMIEIEAQAVI